MSRGLNLRRLDDARDTLLHVYPTLRIGALASMLLEIPAQFPDYHHVLLHEVSPRVVDLSLVAQLQAVGFELLEVPDITEELVWELNAAAAILYDVYGKKHKNLGTVVPSVDYAYHHCDPAIVADVTIRPSRFDYDCTGTKITRPYDLVLPPLVNTRGLRGIAGQLAAPTVGLIMSHTAGKFPYGVAQALAAKLPPTTRFLMSVFDAFDWDAAAWATIRSGQLVNKGPTPCPQIPNAAMAYLSHCDVVVYATDTGRTVGYGRTVTEAMALGKTVVCSASDVFSTRLSHKIDALLFTTPEEAAALTVATLKDADVRARLGAAAQLTAAKDDLTLHVGKLKRLLRMISQ